MQADWASYDSAAESHDLIATRSYFAKPAADLVAACDLPSAANVLDVGTGSGIVAVLTRKAAPHARITGIDPSLEMLRIARKRGVQPVVAGAVPALPFRAGCFDRVLAGFVITHVPSYEAALSDMVRVLASGGRIGVTAWGSLENPHREFWHELARSAVGADALAKATEEALPWEDWFAQPEHLRNALLGAGLRTVIVHRAIQTVEISTADFLSLRENSMTGRFLRHNLDTGQWERFKQKVRYEFEKRFSDPLVHTRDALIATGTRP